ncbi:MAG: 1-acyl-sn-glycerol-3-phosphate acyltransferase, partial [Myxococcota bacterium]
AQIALKYGKTIVPVGCNGSDKCYPRSSPFAKGGHITYRFGAPITPEEMAPFATNASFEPFTAAAETAHRDAFQGLVDLVMDRINPLLDPEYQFSDTLESGGVGGADRFV